MEVLPSLALRLSECCWLTSFSSAFVSLIYEAEDGEFELRQTEESFLLQFREKLTLGRGESFPKGFDANDELLVAPRHHLSMDVLFQFVPNTYNQI